MFDVNFDDEPELPLPEFDIHRRGRAWEGEECLERFRQLGELKFEMSGGKLFFSEHTRLLLLGMLLENVGLDGAVRLGTPEKWKEAVAALEIKPSR
jgi:hypothetical protein